MLLGIESGEIEWQDDATEETAPFPFSEIIYVVFGSMVLRLLAKNYYSSHHILVHSHVIAEHLEKGIVAGLMFKSTKKRVMLALSQLGLKQVEWQLSSYVPYTTLTSWLGCMPGGR
jgi:hypothetical protein